ncbi:hypothetical protein [Saccharopolyspora rosea]|uniref:Excreted virulence factor EspC, type VII ESX diderm n=1 Tax=Saccharopolyspora rosea TaxID=524884 RepID=A0ABW3FMU1_9PSEU|nr:hypothetical protein [Saccharopolyspora rosea]
MAGIRIDAEQLARCAADVRTAGEEIAEVERGLSAVELAPEVFGSSGVARAYQDVLASLRERTGRVAETFTGAAAELRMAVEQHTARDADVARGLRRGAER